MTLLLNQRSERHVEETKGFFDDLAGGWSKRYADDPAMFARSQRFYSSLIMYQQPGAKLLDFGCGSGLVAKHLADKGYNVTGVDVSPEMIEHANLLSSVSGPEFRVYAGKGELPFEADSYDAVISSSVFEYLPDPQAILSDFHRVLKNGGTLLLTVPDMRNSFRKKESIKRALMLFPPIHYFLKKSRWREGLSYLRLSCNRFSIERWQRILDAAGFEVLSVPDEQGTLVMLSARAQDVR